MRVLRAGAAVSRVSCQSTLARETSSGVLRMLIIRSCSCLSPLSRRRDNSHSYRPPPSPPAAVAVAAAAIKSPNGRYSKGVVSETSDCYCMQQAQILGRVAAMKTLIYLSQQSRTIINEHHPGITSLCSAPEEIRYTGICHANGSIIYYFI